MNITTERVERFTWRNNESCHYSVIKHEPVVAMRIEYRRHRGVGFLPNNFVYEYSAYLSVDTDETTRTYLGNPQDYFYTYAQARKKAVKLAMKHYPTETLALMEATEKKPDGVAVPRFGNGERLG